MRNDSAPPEEARAEAKEPALPTLAEGKADSTKSKMTGKKKAAKVKPQRGAKSESAKQMTLGFDKGATSAKRNKETGKKHGAKKAKK